MDNTEHEDGLLAELRSRTAEFEIVEQPTDEQLRTAAAELRHAARWLKVSRGRTGAVTVCYYVDEHVADPRWQRCRALLVSREALLASLDELGPGGARARRLCRLVEHLLLGDEIDQRLDAIEGYQLL